MAGRRSLKKAHKHKSQHLEAQSAEIKHQFDEVQCKDHNLSLIFAPAYSFQSHLFVFHLPLKSFSSLLFIPTFISLI